MSKLSQQGFIDLIMIIVITIISCCLWLINRNIGMFFLFGTCSLYLMFSLSLTNINGFKKGSDVSPFAIMLIMFYLFVMFVPTIKFYIDIPDYFGGNILMKEGYVIKTETPKTHVKVYIDDIMVTYWDWSINYKEFPEGSKMKIYYLKRSMQGVDYELIKK